MKPRVSSAEGEVVESGRVPVVCDQGPCSPPNTPATRYWTESPGDSPVSIQGWNGDPRVGVVTPALQDERVRPVSGPGDPECVLGGERGQPGRCRRHR